MQFLFHVNQSHFHKNGTWKLGNGLFDLNTQRVDGKIFESGKKRLRIQKYPDRCGGGLSREFPHKKIIFILLDSLTLDLSAGTGKLCTFGNLGIVFICCCFVSCLLFMLFYVSLRNLCSGTCRKILNIPKNITLQFTYSSV